MSISKRWMTKKNVAKTVKAYCAGDKPTLEELSKRFGTTFHTIQYIVKHALPKERYEKEKQLRYSRSKMGESNPMKGKNGEAHHLWKGDCEDGHGYLTRMVDGKRYFLHRIVAAKMIGIHVSQLPDSLHIHHIDGDTKNNHQDNLALTTTHGHRTLHAQESRYRRSPMWVKWLHGTSQLKEIIHTEHRDS